MINALLNKPIENYIYINHKIANKIKKYKPLVRLHNLVAWGVYTRLFYLMPPECEKNIDGVIMFLNPKTLSLFDEIIMGVYEEYETTLFLNLINRDYTMLDIGANIGWYTLNAARIIGENGKIYAFEPISSNYNLLKKSIEHNGFKNIILEQKAVSDSIGKVKIFLAKYNIGNHSIVNIEGKRNFIEVETIRLDTYFEENTKIDIVKMDVEGSEGKVIRGMGQIFRNNDDLIIFTEFWPDGIERSGLNPEKFIDELLNHNFRLYLIHKYEKKIERIEKNALMRLIDKNNPVVNLLCIKGKYRSVDGFRI